MRSEKWKEKAGEINAKLDEWIQSNRATGRFPGNGYEGQGFLIENIAAALAQAHADGRNEAITDAAKATYGACHHFMTCPEIKEAVANVKALKDAPEGR